MNPFARLGLGALWWSGVAGLILLSGCVATGMHAEKRDLSGLPRLTPGTRLASPLDPPRVPRGGSVTLRSPLRTLSLLGGNQLFFAPVRINGRRGDLLIDTGCDITGLTADFAERGRVPLSPPAGTAAFAHDPAIPHAFGVHWGRVDGFTLGPWMLGSRTVAVSDHAFFFRVLGVPVVRASGVLGMDVLRHFRVTFDYRRGTCTLSGPAGGEAPAGALPLLIARSSGRPQIVLQVNSQVTTAFLPDSGATERGVLAASVWKRLGLAGPVAKIRVAAQSRDLGEVPVVRAEGEYSILPLRVLADPRGRVTLDFLRGRASLP